MSTLRYWAAARAAAGTAEEQTAGATLEAALSDAVARHGSGLEKVLQVCSFVVDGDPVGTRPRDTVALRPDAVVEVLPPFAGG